MKVQSGFIKVACEGWIVTEMHRQARRRGVQKYSTNVVMGLVDGRLKRWIDEGQRFIYLDHAYFQRGWSTNNFRAVSGACHLNTIKTRPGDRMKRFGVKVEPWRKQRGSKIVVIPTYDGHHKLWPGMSSWLADVQVQIAALTDRPVVVKYKKGNLREFLEDAWAVVCNQSVAGVEAALMGVPVFSTPKCASYPVSNSLDRIENPTYPDCRHEWAASLAYAQWNASEIDEVNWLDYDYSLCDDVPPEGVAAVR